jgi:hypothetical protein
VAKATVTAIRPERQLSEVLRTKCGSRQWLTAVSKPRSFRRACGGREDGPPRGSRGRQCDGERVTAQNHDMSAGGLKSR